ncbi:unnamed protein product [Calicophoron daubneyi]|uniref:HpcH/HpaI aldolase/citrate lyase domain-containing protein n=1 Tax=Calicophoron daubneyi TaxID=300641 RepID=A0AAV2TDS3_CALDB
MSTLSKHLLQKILHEKRRVLALLPATDACKNVTVIIKYLSSTATEDFQRSENAFTLIMLGSLSLLSLTSARFSLGGRIGNRVLSLSAWSQCRQKCYSADTSTLAPSSRLWRSFFYVPGDRPHMIKKMADLHSKLDLKAENPRLPDLVVLDCEDAVALDRKNEARRAVAESLALPNGGQFATFREKLQRLLIVRINSVESGFARTDLEAVMEASLQSADATGGRWPGPDLLCLPKVESADELRWLSSSTEQILLKTSSIRSLPPLGLVAMIESCKAIVNLPVICKEATNFHIPLLGVVFGSDDFCATLGVERSQSNTELSYSRQYVPVVAKAFGLGAIDMVDIDFKDTSKLEANCRYGAQLGFHGKQTIHPAQLPTVNTCFAPSSSQIEWSRALLQEASKHSGGDAVGAGAFNFRGHMIDRPTLKQAENTVRMVELIDIAASQME